MPERKRDERGRFKGEKSPEQKKKEEFLQLALERFKLAEAAESRCGFGLDNSNDLQRFFARNDGEAAGSGIFTAALIGACAIALDRISHRPVSTR